MRQKFLYEKISAQIKGLVDKGVIKVGDRLISVRNLSKEKNVSLNTAFKAYQDLVIKGIVETRPRSGYYVSNAKLPLPIEQSESSKTEHRSGNIDNLIEFANNMFSNEDIVRLSVTTPHVTLLPSAKLNKSMNEALRKSVNNCLDYERIEGNTELRNKIARHTFGWGGYSEPSEIIITQGCIEAIVLGLMTVTKPGDTVIIERPTYFSIYKIIKNLGLKIIEIGVHPIGGLNFNQLEKCISGEKISACIIITNFSNPTGHLMSDEHKERLVDILTKNKIPLIEDDVYGEIYFNNSRPLTCKQLDKKGLVLLCSSFSKTLAPGYRIGWCLPGKFRERFLDIKLAHTVSTASPTQAAIAQFFNSGRYDLHIKNLRKQLQLQCTKYLDAIAKYFPTGTRSTKPKGGFVLWIELPSNINSVEVFHKALNLGISIWPGPIFSASEGFENFIRISYGNPFDERVKNSLKLLGKLCTASS